MFLFRLIYNGLLPIVFLFFLPPMLWKLWRRPGYKKTYAERFGIFSKSQKARIAALGEDRVWLHSVSVGETQIAVNMIKKWLSENPNLNLVVSTTTTTGQEIARTQLPESVVVIYMPIDFYFFIRRALKLVRPKRLVIFETEIWPEIIFQAKNMGAKILLANGRMSDKSSRGYHRFAIFFAPMLKAFDVLCVQTEADKARYQKVCRTVQPIVTGNMKFDQLLPSGLDQMDAALIFGEKTSQILTAASTHPGEEAWVLRCYDQLKKEHPALKLILVPRHAERGNDIEAEIKKYPYSMQRRSQNRETPQSPIDILLADTTGEMLKWMTLSDVVIMGKTLAGHDEGHNLIEPALLSKPIVTGKKLKNFRFVLNVLQENEAVKTVGSEDELFQTTLQLFNQPELGIALGAKAKEAIAQHEGATQKTINELEKLK